MSSSTVPDWPLIEATTRPDGSAEVVIAGTSHPIDTTSLEDARAAIVATVTETAVELGRPVRMTATGPDGRWPLVVHPDGSVLDDDTASSPRAPRRAAAVPSAPPAPPAPPAPAGDAVPQPTQSTTPGLPTGPSESAQPTPAPPAPEPAPTPEPEVAPSAPPAPSPSAAPPAPAPGAPSPSPAPTAPGAWAPGTAAPAYPGQSAAPVLTSPTAPQPPGPLPLSSTLSSLAAPTPPRGVGTQHQPSTQAAPETRRERRSFLTEEQREEPATQGVRGLLTRAGVRMSPSDAERAERADRLAVSQHWPGPRTIAVVNGKGGAGKTPTTVLLAAVFARYGGAGVLTWDNNQTRGTLGWRTEQGPHEATLLDLLPQVDRLLSTGAQSADLAHYVHHQTRDRFDVLRSKPMALAQDQRIEPEDVDAIHAVAAKYYRLIFIDSGNDESDPMWRRMIHHADQIVVATTTRDDHAEAGALLLEGLATVDAKAAELARNAVVVVSQADPKATTADVQRVATGYGDLARETVTVPFDPAMVDGVLRHGSLRPATQRAWLAAGAAVARGL
ncbi:AAA family ATPase [Sanguibacter sp. 4.1]|uniref:AAA family ATPase n=1 Tax=Sanguibacter biliveldensis TaxID=3030830 RepID=A0AAF1BYR1_9MICO|nr:AAA family ATPase [Sanguibacter sp. 4.1]WPF82307.1 AAA family ATPase [Sanguibacter sp. 4.1]